MKLTLISDTHNRHEEISLPEGDILIHAGDFTNGGTLEETEAFAKWFSEQNFKHKIVIAGNHERCFDSELSGPSARALFDAHTSKGVSYLQDSSLWIGDLHIYGSPYTPIYADWAFERQRGDSIKRIWDRFPRKIDILVTHGPPLAIRDKTQRGVNVGCEDLLKKILFMKPYPRLHVFGHVHEGSGVAIFEDRKAPVFVNAAMGYKLEHKPIVVEFNIVNGLVKVL